MVQTIDTSLEQRILDLEATVRSLRSANPFGLLAASDPSQVIVQGPTGVSSATGWTVAGPIVDLLVNSGRLLVHTAASFDIAGNNTRLYAGYQLYGPAASLAVIGSAPVLLTPSFEKSASLEDNGGPQGTGGAFSNFDLVTGLAPGWYRVVEAFALSFTSNTAIPTGIATNRRVAAMPY